VPDSAVGLGRGVLRQALTAGRFELARHEPSALLAPFVDYHWIVRWDLRGQPPHEQTILPHPNVHLVFEASGAGIYGVDRALFVRVLTGRGVVLGVRFRAGCFRPFWQAPISQLSDRVVPAARLFGPRGVSPKWVMRRARLHEAASRADLGEVVDWARLAVDLGYADQAHLTRDFTATIGVPPGRYAGVSLSP
jgi:hypothetical protein